MKLINHSFLRSTCSVPGTSRYPWVEHTNSHLDKAAMVLAVCEVNASSMTKHRTPWQIGKQYQESVTAPNTGIWGSYPLSAWFAQRSVGYGYLIYAPAQQMWTAWYGAPVPGFDGKVISFGPQCFSLHCKSVL